MSRALALARQLADTHNLPDGDLLYLLEHRDPEAAELLRSRAQALCQEAVSYTHLDVYKRQVQPSDTLDTPFFELMRAREKISI